MNPQNFLFKDRQANIDRYKMAACWIVKQVNIRPFVWVIEEIHVVNQLTMFNFFRKVFNVNILILRYFESKATEVGVYFDDED